jgi:hypothetical protein
VSEHGERVTDYAVAGRKKFLCNDGTGSHESRQ